MDTVSQSTRLLEWASYYKEQQQKNADKPDVKCYIKSFDFKQEKPVAL